MLVRILGDLEVEQDGRVVALGSHQQRAVLAMLALHAGEVVGVDRLVDGLWGDTPPATAAKTLQVYVSRLRRVLAGADATRRSSMIVTRDRGYVLQVGPEELDLAVFEALLDAGRDAHERGEDARAAAVLRAALALWRGAPLVEFADEPFARDELARLEELRLEAVETRIDADLALGRHRASAAELKLLVAAHPLRERLRFQRMLALYRSGRQPEALEVYRDTRRLLADELGLEPSRSLRELHDAMLRQDPALEPAADAAASPSVGVRPHRERHPPRRAVMGAAAVVVVIALVAASVLFSRSGPRSVAVAANSVAVIDPARDVVTRDIAVGVRPAGIAVGAGRVWVDNVADHSVSEIDSRHAQVSGSLSPEGASVDALAVGRGALWTMDFSRATVLRIDPTFGDTVRKIGLGARPDQGLGGAIPSPIAVGDGSVWVAPGDSTIARIEPRTGRIMSRVAVGNQPAAIAAGTGAAWVADDVDDSVSRVDAAGVTTPVLQVGAGPSGIAVGAGSVWVANTHDDTVTRIDATTDATKSTIAVGAGPRGIAVGAGAVWVADSRDGTITRIDPRTDHTVTIPVGRSPQNVAIAAGRVWVTVQAAVPAPATAPAGGTLRITQQNDFGSTDPAVLSTFGPQAVQLAYATCARLLTYPDRPAPQGTQLIPEVAAELPTVSRDGRTYTFTIRPGYRFSPPSNQPVTARAFQRAIERSLSPGMQPLPPPAGGYSLAPDMADIVGYAAYRAGRTTHLAGVSATATRLTIRLRAPAPSLPARMAMLPFCAVPPQTPIRPGGVEGIPSAGPYYIQSHTQNAELLLRRNPNYHGPRPHRFDTIDYRFGATEAQQIKLVESGRADVANGATGPDSRHVVPAAVNARLDRDSGFGSPAARAGRQRSFVSRWIGVTYLLLNEHRPLFRRAAMRRAVNFAVDRPALAANAGPGFSGQPTDQYLPRAMPGFRDADIYPLGGPDVARARRLGDGHGARATMITCTGANCLHQAETVQANLRQIGVDVQITQLPLDRLLQREGTQSGWDIAWFGWISDYGDPGGFIAPTTLGFALDYPGAHRYYRRVVAAAKLSGAARLRAYGQLDIDLATHLAPDVPYANVTIRDLFSARIGCQTFQPLYGMDLATLCRQ